MNLLHDYPLSVGVLLTPLSVACMCIFPHFCPSHLHTLTQSRGTASNTRGTAFVVYEDIFDAKNACEHLSGFNVCNRYLVVLYYQPHKVLHIHTHLCAHTHARTHIYVHSVDMCR